MEAFRQSRLSRPTHLKRKVSEESCDYLAEDFVIMNPGFGHTCDPEAEPRPSKPSSCEYLMSVAFMSYRRTLLAHIYVVITWAPVRIHEFHESVMFVETPDSSQGRLDWLEAAVSPLNETRDTELLRTYAAAWYTDIEDIQYSVAHRDSDRKVCPLCRQPLAGISKTGLGHTLINIRQHIKCLDCSKKDVDKKEAFYCNDCIRTLCSGCSNMESLHQTHTVVPFSSEMALKLCMEYWKREQSRIEEATSKNQVIAEKLKKFVLSDGFMDALLLKIKQFILRYLDDCFEAHLNNMKNDNDRMARSFAFRASSLENLFGDLLLERDENQEIGVNDNENAKVSDDNLKDSKNDANKLSNELDGVEVSTDMDNKVIGEEKCEKLSESIMKLPEKLPDHHDDKILSSLYRNVLPFKDADVLTDDTCGMYHSSYVDHPLLDVADKPLDCLIEVATSRLASRLESDTRSMIRCTLLRYDFLDNTDWAWELKKFEERKKQAAAGTKADSIADSATTSEATTIGKQENGKIPGTDDAVADNQAGQRSPDSASRQQQTDKLPADDVSKADDGPVDTSASGSVVNSSDDKNPPIPSESTGASQPDADLQDASGSENPVSSHATPSDDLSDSPGDAIEAAKMGPEADGSESPDQPPVVVVGSNHEHDSDGWGSTDSESTMDECQMGIFDMVDARNNSLRARVCAMDYNASMKQVVVAAGPQRFFVTPLAASALGRCIQMPKYQWPTDPGDDVHFTSLATHGENVFAFTPQGMVLSLIDSGTWTVRSAVRLTPRFEPINRMSATAAYLYILTQRELVRISVDAFKGLPPPSATEGPSTIADAVVEVIFRSEGSDGLFRDFCIVPSKRWILLSQSPYMSLTNNVDSSDDDNESDDGYYDVFGQANRVKHNKLHVIDLVTLVLIQTHTEFYKSKNADRNRTNLGQKLLVTASPSGKYVFLYGWWDYDEFRAYDFSGETPKPVGFLPYDEDTIVHMVCPTPTLLYCMEESEGHQDPAIAMLRLKPEGSESAEGQDNPDGSANDTFLEYEPENKPSTPERIWE